ncbi:MAG: hypothetical protein LBT94_08725 [Prevotellaceae bacterium]|jgi:hypothetical protein|nr:hypothetical protein [Prevotellaceae bacterium]
MRSNLDAALPAGKIKHVVYSDGEIYVMDYTERTQSKRKVEVCNTKPEDMDVLTLKNEARLNITTSIFGEQCLMDDQNREIEHCECVLYPTNSTPNTWVLFVELKDCKPKNISSYFASAKAQIVKTVKLFRDRNLLEPDKRVHAVISFPRRKVDFHSNIISQRERQDFLRQDKIIMRGANTVTVKSDGKIV